MDPFGWKATTLATIIATLLSIRAIRKQSLTHAGAITAFLVGFLSVITGLRGLNLLVFYQVATIATKYQKDVKQLKDGTCEKSSIRGVSQVLACSILSVTLSLLHAIVYGKERPIDFTNSLETSRLTCAILAHYATCLADTLASELGILSKQGSPILITQPWKRVPPGTNGGITFVGTCWSAVGGAIMGLSTIAIDFLSGIYPLQPIPVIVYGTICGFLGSLIDSLLGATLQQSYWDEDQKRIYHSHSHPKQAKLIVGLDWFNNEQVNLISVAITTFLGGWIIGPWVFEALAFS